MNDPVFAVGDKVTPVYMSGYHLTEGKVYEVVKFEETFYDEGFRWPACVQFQDDRGRLVTAHARRFKLA